MTSIFTASKDILDGSLGSPIQELLTVWETQREGCVSARRTGQLLECWIHFSSDGSETWVQKDSVYLLDLFAFEHVRDAPKSVVYLPRRYATPQQSA